MSPQAVSPIDELRAEVAALRLEVGELRAAGPPEWAGQLDRRIERTTVLLERLASRVETPVPRLDEPLTLLTVSACMLVLGFIAGRSARRRTERRDARFRL